VQHEEADFVCFVYFVVDYTVHIRYWCFAGVQDESYPLTRRVAFGGSD
jgi:hypothetical protein